MRRFAVGQVNREILAQNRNIRTWIVCGGAAAIGGALMLVLQPFWHWLWSAVYITMVAFGFLAVCVNVLMIMRMPALDNEMDEWRIVESVHRPAVQIGRQTRIVNWHPIMTRAQWSCVCARVRTQDYYISRPSLNCGLSSEQYQQLRAELVRCGVITETGNDVLPDARHVFGGDNGMD